MRYAYLALLAIMTLLGCDVFDIDVDRSDGDSPLNSVTFSGRITIAQNGETTTDVLDLSMFTADPMVGSFFRRGDGAVGSITGVRTGQSASFTGMIESYCPGSVTRGTLRIEDDNSLALTMDGVDCEGPFTVTGLLGQDSCKDLRGRYWATETLEVTFTVGSEHGSISVQGSGELNLTQTNCEIRFEVPGGYAEREGRIEGNTLRMGGAFVIPYGEDITVDLNTFVIDANITDPYNITFGSEGVARGTVDGQPFTVYGTSSGTLEREFDVVVAMLHGGVGSGSGSGEVWERLTTQVTSIGEHRVVARDFPSGIGQIVRVEHWLDQMTHRGATNSQVLLVGHSAGGHALVRVGEYEDDFRFVHMDSRITLDPFDPMKPDGSQHNESHPIVRPQGRFYNYRAAMASYLTLFGYQVEGTTEPNETWAGVAHSDMVLIAHAREYVANEVRYLLSTQGSRTNSLPVPLNIAPLGKRLLINPSLRVSARASRSAESANEDE